VGLGGRLDATNVVAPVAVAITAVDFDHQQFLGDTLAAIATEKAAVIKAGSFAVLGRNPNLVESIVADRCRETGADFVRAAEGVDVSAEWDAGHITLQLETPRHRYASLRLALRGRHQIDNAMTAIRLLEELSARRLFNVPPDAIRLAVEDVTWPGRLEVFRAGSQEVLIDGAHNAAGARALVNYLRETYGRRVPMIVGVMRDKDVTAVVATLASAASQIVCTAAESPRAMVPQELAAVLQRCAPEVHVDVAATSREALDRMTGQGSPIVVAGSLYLAGEVRAELS
jgi:dihydrofolate synthase/folylpolyglutamate synthase